MGLKNVRERGVSSWIFFDFLGDGTARIWSETDETIVSLGLEIGRE